MRSEGRRLWNEGIKYVFSFGRSEEEEFQMLLSGKPAHHVTAYGPYGGKVGNVAKVGDIILAISMTTDEEEFARIEAITPNPDNPIQVKYHLIRVDLDIPKPNFGGKSSSKK